MRRYLIFLVFPAFLFSSVSDAGSYFLLLFYGSRATGMGAAFTAVSEDLSSSYYNPAGLSFIKAPEILFDYSKWNTRLWPNEYYCSFGFLKPAGKKGVLSGNMIYSKSEGMKSMIELKNTFFSKTLNGNFALILNYAYRIRENLGIGAGFKFIYKLSNPNFIGPPVRLEIIEVSGKTFAFDAGLLYRLNLNKNNKFFPYINIGLSFLNFGPDIKDEEDGYGREPLPRTFKFGIASYIYNSNKFKLLFATDITKVLNNITNNLKNRGWNYVWKEAWKHLGMELNYLEIVSLRIGYFYDFEGKRKGFTFGLGLKLGRFNFNIGTEHFIYSFNMDNFKFSIGNSF